MVQISISTKTCIDIYETDAFYADISLFDTRRKIGPEYDLAALNKSILDFLYEFGCCTATRESEKLELRALENNLLNCQLEDEDLLISYSDPAFFI
ncbi:MAG: hypothetical protein L0Z73_01575 [Gammaproteobacteria bacterium]|nr:hypothetical protein [Gammaproteobacteria bacterium]